MADSCAGAGNIPITIAIKATQNLMPVPRRGLDPKLCCAKYFGLRNMAIEREALTQSPATAVMAKPLRPESN
jgi:hypothetical protein